VRPVSEFGQVIEDPVRIRGFLRFSAQIIITFHTLNACYVCVLQTMDRLVYFMPTFFKDFTIPYYAVKCDEKMLIRQLEEMKKFFCQGVPDCVFDVGLKSCEANEGAEPTVLSYGLWDDMCTFFDGCSGTVCAVGGEGREANATTALLLANAGS